MLRIDNIRVYEDLNKKELFDYCIKKYKINRNDLNNISIAKKSIDARKKDNVHYNYSIDIDVKDESKYSKFRHIEYKEEQIIKRRNSTYRPIIVGAGPSGLFCALTLIDYGYKPIIIEQGNCVDKRVNDILEYQKNGILNELSNVQFGEGGAGTFSDGKLTTGISSKYIKKVLNYFYKFGAPEEILYLNKPHIGTDNLFNILKNIRKYIETNGGTYYFNTKLLDIKKVNENIKLICSNNQEFITDALVLAIGHSARDTYFMLQDKKMKMQAKNFAVGLRIEHLQKLINDSQYGTITKLKLPPAEYKLVYHDEATNRSCFTFCMCPGGEVIASSSNKGQIVTNGMSYYKRDKENANAALLVNVTVDDLNSDNPLKGIEFCEKLELDAYVLGGSNNNAPVQRVEDFLKNKKSTFIGKIKPTYKPGVTLSNLNDILPKFVSDTLKSGILAFDKKIKGFASDDAILTGVETRTSSVVTLVRDENLESSIKGIYPCGEGAGYAGGITSSCIDGIKVAIKIIEK